MGALAEGWQTPYSASSSTSTSSSSSHGAVTGMRISTAPGRPNASGNQAYPRLRCNGPRDEPGRRGLRGGGDRRDNKPTAEKTPEDGQNRNPICIPGVRHHVVPHIGESYPGFNILNRHTGNVHLPESRCSYSLIEGEVGRKACERVVHGIKNWSSQSVSEKETRIDPLTAQPFSTPPLSVGRR